MLSLVIIWFLIGLISLCAWMTRLRLVINNYGVIFTAAFAGPFTNIIIWYLHVLAKENVDV